MNPLACCGGTTRTGTVTRQTLAPSDGALELANDRLATDVAVKVICCLDLTSWGHVPCIRRKWRAAMLSLLRTAQRPFS